MPAKSKRTPRKRVSTTKTTAPSIPTPIGPVAANVPIAPEPEVEATPDPAPPARRKRALIDELKSEHTSRARQLEIRAIIDGELADVPILSHREIARLGT